MPLFTIIAGMVGLLGLSWLWAARPNSDMNALDPPFRLDAEKALADSKAAGVPLAVYETRRSLFRQAFLWAQGRDKDGNIVDNGKVVTWTMKSRHLTGEAIDVNPIGAKTPQEWTNKLASVYPIWAKYGLVPLTKDHPGTQDGGHFQRA